MHRCQIVFAFTLIQIPSDVPCLCLLKCAFFNQKLAIRNWRPKFNSKWCSMDNDSLCSSPWRGHRLSHLPCQIYKGFQSMPLSPTFGTALRKELQPAPPSSEPSASGILYRCCWKSLPRFVLNPPKTLQTASKQSFSSEPTKPLATLDHFHCWVAFTSTYHSFLSNRSCNPGNSWHYFLWCGL